MRDLEYEAAIEAVAKEYAPKMTKLLTDLGESLRGQGYRVGDILDMTDSEYRFDLSVMALDGTDFNLCVTMLEERVNEGGDGYGVNFDLTITVWSGILVGQWCPYNYSPQWVVDSRDPDAVSDRWLMFERGADFAECYLLMEATCGRYEKPENWRSYVG